MAFSIPTLNKIKTFHVEQIAYSILNFTIAVWLGWQIAQGMLYKNRKRVAIGVIGSLLLFCVHVAKVVAQIKKLEQHKRQIEQQIKETEKRIEQFKNNHNYPSKTV